MHFHKMNVFLLCGTFRDQTLEDEAQATVDRENKATAAIKADPILALRGIL
jgi:hypothetical protein